MNISPVHIYISLYADIFNSFVFRVLGDRAFSSYSYPVKWTVDIFAPSFGLLAVKVPRDLICYLPFQLLDQRLVFVHATLYSPDERILSLFLRTVLKLLFSIIFIRLQLYPSRTGVRPAKTDSAHSYCLMSTSTQNTLQISTVNENNLNRYISKPNSVIFTNIQRSEMSVQQYLMSITTAWDKHINDGPAVTKLPIGGSHPCFIIAEIGQNHQGDINIAKDLIRIAKEAGANCVKFQKSSLRDRFTKAALDAPYESPNSFGKTYGEHRARLEFSDDELRELQRYAEEVTKIMFTASPMDISSADLLIGMKVPFIKIGSGDTNNYGLIEHVAKANIPIVLSTGMSEFRTVQHAYNIITKYHNNVVLLHCVSSYPTLPKDSNLRVMDLYRSEFTESPIGYSSHEIGFNVCVAAVARGAKVIEKHITKDHTMKGTDHSSSLEPSQLAAMVTAIREVEASLGEAKKKILPCEEPCLNKLGKSICTTRKIPAGAIIRPTDLIVKVSRPMGIRPQEMPYVIGATMATTIDADTPLTSEDVIL